MKYTKHVSAKKTDQKSPIPGKAMIKNNAGGFTFKLDPWQVLDRFLILGSEGGTYYVGEKKLTQDNAKNIAYLIRLDGKKVVDRLVEVSEKGLAPSNDPALFTLALCISFGDDKTRSHAYAAIPKVARIGTHLFHLVRDTKELKGWSRGLRSAIARWYTEMPEKKLATQLVKYRQRDGWSHKDLLRLSHPSVAKNSEKNKIFKWVTDETSKASKFANGKAIEAYIQLSAEKTVPGIVKLIKEYKDDVFWEMVPSDYLKEAKVWTALVENGLPMGALVRNLGRLTSLGVLKPLSSLTSQVIEQLGNEEAITKSRLHPYQALVALKTYQKGHGFKGNLTWTPIGAIVDVLDEVFYKAFKNVPSTGKRFLLGLDVSGSMTIGSINGTDVLTPREGSTAMALVTAKAEKNTQVFGFSNSFMDLKISAKDTLVSAMKKTKDLPFEGTDCALPMIYALRNKLEVDVFTVYTDNETWAGKEHPVQALKKYRDAMGIPAKLVVVGMTATEFTIADPDDFGMLDIVGFDASAPQVMAQFSK